MPAVNAVAEAFNHSKEDPIFKAELKNLFDNYANRPSLLYHAKNMSKDLGGAQIYFKREDLNHTGAHKINNFLGQALIAETVAALFGMEAEILMGKEDTDRQALNVYRMKLLGAKVNIVETGTQVLKDSVALTDKTNIVILRHQQIMESEFDPTVYGFDYVLPEALLDGAKKNMVILNAAMALFAANVCDDLQQATKAVSA